MNKKLINLMFILAIIISAGLISYGEIIIASTRQNELYIYRDVFLTIENVGNFTAKEIDIDSVHLRSVTASTNNNITLNINNKNMSFIVDGDLNPENTHTIMQNVLTFAVKTLLYLFDYSYEDALSSSLLNESSLDTHTGETIYWSNDMLVFETLLRRYGGSSIFGGEFTSFYYERIFRDIRLKTTTLSVGILLTFSIFTAKKRKIFSIV